MKKELLLIIVLFANFSFAQSPHWIWAKSAGSGDVDYGQGIAVDRDGNSYVVGTFSSSYITFGTTTLSNASIFPGSDVFLVKYNSAGTVRWARKAGSSLDDVARGISIDSLGNVFITGYFNSSTISFGSYSLTNSSTTSHGNIFVVKYDSSGTVKWAQKAGGTNNDVPFGINTDKVGNTYITGTFSSTTIFFNAVSLANGGYFDMFLTKYDSSGNALWAKAVKGNEYEAGHGVYIDRTNDDVVVSGDYRSTTVLVDTVNIANSSIGTNKRDVIMIRYDKNGNLKSVHTIGGNDNEYNTGIACDAESNVYVIGNFDSPAIKFDTILLNNSNPGSDEIYISKYDSAFRPLWSKTFSGISNDYLNGISVARNEDIYVAGSFSSAVLSVDTFSLNNSGYSDAMIVRLDSSGKVVWLKKPTGIDYDVCNGITIDENKNIYITGDFANASVSFDSCVIYNGGYDDMFIAKLSDSLQVGIDVLSAKNGFITYPNPSHNTFTISFPDQISNFEYQISIYDVMGREVYTQTIRNIAQSEIRNSFSPGVYFVKVTAGERVWTEKVVVE